MANKDFIIENDVLIEYTGEGGEVVITNGVTSIGDEAFADCNGLTGVEIPNGDKYRRCCI